MKLRTAYTFFATLALCSCAMVKPIGEKQTLISELPKGEYKKSTLAVGEQKDLAQQRGQKLGFVRNKEVEAYLGKVRDKLVAKSGVSGVPGKVILTASSDFNAYSTADGNIYMSMLAFQRLDSEDEAAALIGHELGHVLLTHHNSSILSKTQNQAKALYEMGMAVKGQLNDKAAQGQKDQRDLMIAEMATQVGDKLAMPAWNRTQETAADYLGVDLLSRAGYSPVAMKTMLEKLKAAEVDEKKADEAFQKKLQEVAKRDVSEAVKMFGNNLLAKISTDHPDTGARIKDVDKYMERHYRGVSVPEVELEAWSEIHSLPGVEAVLRNYSKAFDAKASLAAGKAAEAYTSAQAAASKPTATDAYPNWMLANSAFATGQSDKGFEALQRAIASNEPIREMYEGIIAWYERDGHFDKALAWTKKAALAFSETDPWMPTEIRLLRKAARADEAALLMVKCSASAPDFRRECQKANETPMQGRG